MKKNCIPVFFTIDDAYAPFLATSLVSLIENASREYKYKLIVLYQKLSGENQGKIKRLEEPGFEILFIPVKKKLAMIKDQLSNRLRCDYFTLTIYFRLFIPSMFPEYDKGIYLDSDTIITGDISELFGIELGDCLLGAARDYSIRDIPELIAYTDKAVGVGIEHYINSGILVMNLEELRRVRLEERFLELFHKYHFDTVAPDQDYLNAMCYGRIVYLDESWDVMPVQGREPFEKPKLIHYNLFQKPWCYDGVPYEDYFWEYADRSGYIGDIRSYKHSYSEEKRAADTACLRRLVGRTKEIACAPQNFRSVFNSGMECRL